MESHPEWSDPDEEPTEEVVASFDRKCDADNDAKARGSTGGDATHYASHHYVRESSPSTEA